MEKFKIRASALGQIMTEPRAKADKEAGKLSESAKQYLQEWLIAQRYNRKKVVSTAAMLKGTEVEIQSMQDLSLYTGKSYFKNDDQYEDGYFTGTPDIIHENQIIDIKSSYDIFSFHKSECPKRARGYTQYGWQLQAYMHLTGKKHATLAYILTDSPDWVIEDAVKKAWHQMKVETDEEQDLFNDKIEPLIRANHTFSETSEDRPYNFPEVPINDRVRLYSLEYDPEAIAAAQNRVQQIRQILSKEYE